MGENDAEQTYLDVCLGDLIPTRCKELSDVCRIFAMPILVFERAVVLDAEFDQLQCAQASESFIP